ncbi:MAG: HD domain-containing protein [Patescibacteria group bacterium]
MDIKNLCQIIGEKQPLVKTDLLTKTADFFKKNSAKYNFFEKKEIARAGYERALKAANESARLEFICASLLGGLTKKDRTLLPKIKNELNEEIFVLLNCYFFVYDKMYEQHENLLEHSYRTALKLASIKIGIPAICAAMLHEVVHYMPETKEEIKKNFGEETAKLVFNFQKIRALKVAENDKYIQHLREMVVAMAEDLRVIMIKMCSNIDRLKNADLLTEEKKKNVAIESKEILAPLADLMGIWQLRWQLEDYSFKILEPEEYEKISRRFDVDERHNRDKYIIKTKKMIEKIAKEKAIPCHIEGRFKHFYSIYRKMKDHSKSFDDICDVFALRIVVNSVDECYRMLGLIHHLWKPKMRRIKDYISAPKKNGYQSLHTTVFGLNGRSTEFQIRTKEMDEEANSGISAHWYYKNTKKETAPWIQNLIIKQEQYKDNEEFLSKFSSEILSQRIYVYTPKGDILALPTGSTPIDFAYHIHTELGHKCAGAIINDIPVSLDYHLNTNDIIKIIADRSQIGPNPEWLKFVKTNGAKKHIENFFNQNDKNKMDNIRHI